MRSNKVVAITVGTAVLGATGLVGIAATATQAAPATRPVPAPATDTMGMAPLESAPYEAHPVDANAADPATPDSAQRTPESALAEVRRLIQDGVPGASPELDARLKQALRTADQAMTTLHAHTSARDLTRSWVQTTRPADVPESWQLPGASALEKVYGTETNTAPGAVAIPAAPDAAAPQAAAPHATDAERVASPDLGALLGAVTALDLAATLDALTNLLGGVLSTLTSTVFGITGSLTAITGPLTGLI